MITLPDEFVATKYSGYFFNTKDGKLYSLKVDGILKPLKFYRPNKFNRLYYVTKRGGYYCSVKGRKKFYSIEELERIKNHDATIPVRNQ